MIVRSGCVLRDDCRIGAPDQSALFKGEESMVRLTAMALVLVGSFCCAVTADAYDRVASVGESPISAETGPAGDHGMLVDLLRALDRVTHSSTKIVLRPFARSFIETAAGHADFHIPFIQNDGSPAPGGLSM